MYNPSDEDNTIYPSDQGHQTDKSSSNEKVDHGTGHALTDIKAAPHGEDGPTNVFGGENGKSFRTMSRWDTVFVLITNQVGLGILSLPACLKVFGVIPGIIAIVGIGCLSWYTAFELKQFYSKYQHVVNIVDMARVVGGRPFEIIVGIGLMIQVIMTSASAAVTLSIAFNTLSEHSVCTVGFIGIACLGCWVLCAPRTVKFVSQSGVPCAVSVIAAALIFMVSLGVKNPQQAPEGWKVDIKVVGYPKFREGLNACLKIAYAYSGNISFVSYMAEMIDPVNDFGFSLACLEISSITFYTVVAIVIYCLAGEYTTSPALGSAPKLPAMVAYGIIIPAVFSTGLAFGHTGIKYMYVQVMRWTKSTDQITANTTKSWSIWMICVTAFWVLCFIISNAIPVFDSILSIASATTIAWFTFGLSGIYWFHLNWDCKFNGPKKIALTCVNVFLIVISLFMNGGGLWSSITELMDIFADKDSNVQGCFDCGDNSLF
ncbi:Fc.00g031530.m01.CDS01 [Cosmosporella sp. VM-42]